MSEWFEADNAPVGQGNTTAKSGVPADRDMLNRLCKETIAYDCGDPKRIQHFVKVRALARTIGMAEGLDEETLHALEAVTAAERAIQRNVTPQLAFEVMLFDIRKALLCR